MKSQCVMICKIKVCQKTMSKISSIRKVSISLLRSKIRSDISNIYKY